MGSTGRAELPGIVFVVALLWLLLPVTVPSQQLGTAPPVHWCGGPVGDAVPRHDLSNLSSLLPVVGPTVLVLSVLAVAFAGPPSCLLSSSVHDERVESS